MLLMWVTQELKRLIYSKGEYKNIFSVTCPNLGLFSHTTSRQIYSSGMVPSKTKYFIVVRISEACIDYKLLIPLKLYNKKLKFQCLVAMTESVVFLKTDVFF
jgi:hypothetical protein